MSSMREACSVCGQHFDVQFRYQMEERQGGFAFYCSQGCLEQSQRRSGDDGTATCDACATRFRVELVSQVLHVRGQRRYACSMACRTQLVAEAKGLRLGELAARCSAEQSGEVPARLLIEASAGPAEGSEAAPASPASDLAVTPALGTSPPYAARFEAPSATPTPRPGVASPHPPRAVAPTLPPPSPSRPELAASPPPPAARAGAPSPQAMARAGLAAPPLPPLSRGGATSPLPPSVRPASGASPLPPSVRPGASPLPPSVRSGVGASPQPPLARPGAVASPPPPLVRPAGASPQPPPVRVGQASPPPPLARPVGASPLPPSVRAPAAGAAGRGSPAPPPVRGPAAAEPASGRIPVAEPVSGLSPVAEPVSGRSLVAEPVSGRSPVAEPVSGRSPVAEPASAQGPAASEAPAPRASASPAPPSVRAPAEGASTRLPAASPQPPPARASGPASSPAAPPVRAPAEGARASASPAAPLRGVGPANASRPSAAPAAPSSPRLVAVFNHKGGTGKTTTSVSLAAGLALRGKRVLLVDADAQGNVAVSLGVQAERSLYHVLVMGLAAGDAITTVRPGLDLLPSNETLAAAELYLAGRQNRDRVLAARLAPALEGYDYVIVDCSPSLSLLNQNALCLVDSVLVPVACDYLSLVGVRQVIKTVKNVNQLLHHPVRIWGVLPTFFDARAKICNEAVDTLKKHFGDRCLRPVRQAIKVKEAPAQGQTIFEYAAGSPAAEDYASLVDTVLGSRAAAASGSVGNVVSA